MFVVSHRCVCMQAWEYNYLSSESYRNPNVIKIPGYFSCCLVGWLVFKFLLLYVFDILSACMSVYSLCAWCY